MAENQADNPDNRGSGTNPSSLTWGQAAAPVPTGTQKPTYSRGAAKTKARALFSAAPLELPCMFCCNSAITQLLLIGIRRFLVETWTEFQGGSDGELKTTPKPQTKRPSFSRFSIFLRTVWPKTGTPWAYIYNKPQPNGDFRVKKEPPVAGNRRDNCDNHGFGPYPPTQTSSHQGLPGTPRGSKITLLPDGPCGQAPGLVHGASWGAPSRVLL